MQIEATAIALGVLPLFFASRVDAQSIHVVDASGGGQHRTIQAAVDAAKDGDRILVRKGRYAGFTARGKALRVLGDAPYSARPVVVTSPVTIEGIPRGRSFVLGRLLIDASMTIRSSAGRFVASLVDMGEHVSRARRLRIEGCDSFHISDLATSDETSISDSTGTLVTSRILLYKHALATTRPGITAQRSELVLAATSVWGGLAATSLAPAIAMVQSELKIHDEGSHPILGAVRTRISGSGVALVDDDVNFGFGLEPRDAISGPRFELRDYGVLDAGAGRIGRDMLVLLAKRQEHAWALLVGRAGPRVTIPGIGGALELATVDWVLSGVGGKILQSLTVSVPNDGALIGATLSWQGVTLDTRARLEFTNLATNVVLQ